MSKEKADHVDFLAAEDGPRGDAPPRRLSVTGRRVSVVDDVFGEIVEGGPNYRSVGWLGTSVLMMKTQIGLGVLAIPSVFDVLGMIPGLICMISIAVITTWSDYYIGVFKLKHRSVYGIDDAGTLMFGRVGREVLATAYVLYWVFVAGAAMLGISISLNALSTHGACTAVFVAVAAVIAFSFSSVQTLGKISWIAWDRPAAAPPGGVFVSDFKLFNQPKFTDAVTSISSLVFAYSGTPAFFAIVSEMQDPTYYSRAVLLCQSVVTAVYIVIGIVVYYFCGSYVASPALGSAGVLIKKISYGFALPGLIASATIVSHLPAKYVFIRLLRGSHHLTEPTFRHWATWIGCTGTVAISAYVIASAIPVFDGLVSLIGALLGTFMSFQPMGCMWLYDNWALLNYLGFGSNDKATAVEEDKSTAVRALPASWYTQPEMYELEKRAIFSKKWLLITHKVRLSQPGDWLKFEVAGFEFILFEGDQGKARIFSCRYHGWSYGLDGRLAKAPKYDELGGFDKSENGLFPVHVKVDAKGFIWVNLDASPTPEPWENDFAGIDIQERYNQYNFDDYVFSHEYSLEGAYNWKILADNFNECYHCPTTHPTIPQLADITTHDVDVDHGYIKHQSVPTEQQKRDGCAISSTYYFPNVSLSVLPHFIMLQRFLPRGPSSSAMNYQIFRNRHSTDQEFRLISELYAQVVSEDKVLCEAVQRNLNQGLFRSGQLHPRLEKGPLYFQKKNRDVIRAHVDLERAANHQIWPARQNFPPPDDVVACEDEMLCSGLACQANGSAGAGQVDLGW
ncbi:hypothetical protein DV735_g615, partial [Chaetothyriales sp. CBS 134920]